MCNLYRLDKGQDALRRFFKVDREGEVRARDEDPERVAGSAPKRPDLLPA
jgi:hypothetical protein